MKKLMTILGIFLILLIACSTQQAAIPSPTGVKESEPSSVTGTSADAETKMLQDVQSQTEASNSKADVFYLPVNNKIANVGDTVIFGSMFNLVNMPAGTFFARITFIEARDKNSNKIEVDKDTIRSWLRYSDTPTFQLDSGGKFVPIIVKVGSEIKPRVKTVPGAYQYEVTFRKIFSNEFNDPVNGATKSVYVRVE